MKKLLILIFIKSYFLFSQIDIQATVLTSKVNSPALGNVISYTTDSIESSKRVPFTKVFHDIGVHFIGSFTDNYGLSYVMAGIATYGLVQSGYDWKWYRNANDHVWIRNTGFISVSAGGFVPIAVPLGLYLYGRYSEKSDLQITGLALGQAALLGLAISSGIKVFTGRVPPNERSNMNDYSNKFRFGFLRGGAYQGWPSTHTTIAFAMATTLAELYPDNTGVKIGSFTYASLIGLGVSTNIHWLSDAVAGAFIGYVIGKTVGAGFRHLINQQYYSFEVSPTGIGLTLKF